MGKEERLRKIDASTVKTIQSTTAYSPPSGSPTSGNADTVDGYHAAAVPVANYLLALNSSAQVNVDAIPTHDILSKHSVTGSAYQVVGLSASNTLGLLTPASTVGANQIPIGGTGGAITWSGAQTFSALGTFNAGITVNNTVGTFNAGVTIAAGQTITTPAITATANLTINPVGDVVLDPTGNDVLPNTGYDLNLGSLAKKYLTLHAAELWVETLVAQSTIATIGGRILVGPTTTLTRDLTDAATTIYVKHNEMASGDRAYMEANGALEFLAITGAPALQAEGDFAYTVTRNLDGSGANAWSAGDAVFNTGAAGDGFIDIYSVAGVKAGTEYGPAIAGNVRGSATYNDWTTHWAIGNLNGLYGYSSTTYGFAAGKYSTTTSWVAADATNGVRIMRGSTCLGQWQVDGDFLLGTDISAAATTNLAVFNAAQTYNSESVDVGDLLLGDNSSNKANIFWDKSAGRLNFRGGTTVQAYIDTTGAITAGGGDILLNGTGIALAAGTALPVAESKSVTWKTGSDTIADIYAYRWNSGGKYYHTLYVRAPEVVSGGNNYYGHLHLRADYAADYAGIDINPQLGASRPGITLRAIGGDVQLDADTLKPTGYFYPGTGSATQTTGYLSADSSGNLYARGGGFMAGASTATLKQVNGIELQYSDAVNAGFISALNLYLFNNQYYSAGNWLARSTAVSSQIALETGHIYFYTAASATTDNAVTNTSRMKVYNSGGVYIGDTPGDPGANNLIVQEDIRCDNRLYVGGTAYDANSYLTRDVTGPIYNADANDYIQYDRTNNRWLFYIGSAVKGYVDSTGFHDGAPP